VQVLGIDRRTLNIAWTLFLFLLILALVYRLGRVLIIFALALIFAHLLAPVVDFVERMVPERIPRVAVLALVYVVLVGILVAAAIPLGTRVSHEALVLAQRLPDALKGDPLANLPIPHLFESFRPQVTAFAQERLYDLGQTLTPTLSAVGGHILGGLSVLVTMVLIPILSFFFLKDGRAMRDSIVDSFDGPRRDLIDNIFTDIHLLLAQYIRALVILSLSTFTAYSIFLAITGMSFPLLLAGFAALLEFIPAVGPFIGAATIIVSALTTGYGHFIILLIFLALYRIFQDYILSPYLMSSGVALHPLLVLFGILAGNQLLGIPGMFFSVPTMAALRLIIIRLRRRQVRT
jgi:predicted PurR-regulated permease PerM